MARPSPIHFIQCSIIFSYDENAMVSIKSRQTDEPICKEWQVRFAHNTHNHSLVLLDRKKSFLESVRSPPQRFC